MKRRLVNIFAVLALGLTLSCAPAGEISPPRSDITGAESALGQAQASFEDQTREIVGHANRLIEK